MYTPSKSPPPMLPSSSSSSRRKVTVKVSPSFNNAVANFTCVLMASMSATYQPATATTIHPTPTPRTNA